MALPLGHDPAGSISLICGLPESNGPGNGRPRGPGAIITATSTRGPLTAAKAAPELIPKTDTGPDRAGQFEVVGGCSKRERGRVRVVRAHRLRQRREPGMPVWPGQQAAYFGSSRIRNLSTATLAGAAILPHGSQSAVERGGIRPQAS